MINACEVKVEIGKGENKTLMCENVILRQDGRGRCEIISKLGVCMTCC